MVRKRQKPDRVKRHIIPILGKKQRYLGTVVEAKRQIVTVEKEFQGGRAKFIAYTNLLSRAYSRKRQNKEVIRLLTHARDKIPMNWRGEKPFRKKGKAKVVAKLSLQKLGETTHVLLKSLKSQLAKKKFRACQNLIHILVADTSKKECRIVANLLESIAIEAEIKLFSEKNFNSDYANTITKAYSASGELYKKGNILDKAEELFVAAHVLKTKMSDF